MNADEKAAFIQAYCGHVCHYEDDEVSAFIDAHYAAKTQLENDAVYHEHPCYSSVMDALGVWGEAMDFAKLQQKLMNPIPFVGGVPLSAGE